MPGVGPGYLTDDGLLVLQRRATTARLEASIHDKVGVALQPGRGSHWTLHRSRDGRGDSVEVEDLQTAREMAAALATECTGTDIRLADFHAAYMYGAGDPHGQFGHEDRIISPLRFEPGTDTIRIVATNVCVAVFDGSFATARVFEHDAAGSHVWGYVARALRTGFTAGQDASGDDYCKRRLAWLAGCLWLDEATEPTQCGVLRLDMTR